MQTLKIGRTTYPLYFGMDFIREIDKKYGIEENKIQIGLGLVIVIARLKLMDIVTIADLIQAATCTLKQQPSKREIEEFLSEEETDLEELAENFSNAFETQAFIQKTMKNITRAVERANREEEMSQETQTQKEPTTD